MLLKLRAVRSFTYNHVERAKMMQRMLMINRIKVVTVPQTSTSAGISVPGTGLLVDRGVIARFGGPSGRCFRT